MRIQARREEKIAHIYDATNAPEEARAWAFSCPASSWVACEVYPSREICSRGRPEGVENPSFWVPTRARSARIYTPPPVKPLFPFKYLITFLVYVNVIYTDMIYTYKSKKGGVSWIYASKGDKN